MSSPAVWRSPPPGPQPSSHPPPGAPNAAPFLKSAIFSSAGPRHLPAWAPEYGNNVGATPTSEQSCQPTIPPNQDLNLLIQCITSAFESSLNILREELVRSNAAAKHREDILERQIAELREELRLSRAEANGNNAHMPFNIAHFPRPQNNPQRRVWPTLNKHPDTPTTNEYLDSCSNLDKALKEGRSLASPNAKCAFIEHTGNLWEADQDIKVHAVGSDLSLGVGVAADGVRFAGRPDHPPGVSKVGDIIVQQSENVGEIWHLVTKPKSAHKVYKKSEPFLQNVKLAFHRLAEQIKEQKIEELAMSFICSGSDRLNRVWVLKQLYDELKDTTVRVHFYNKFPSKRWMGCVQLFTSDDGTPPEPPVPGEEQATRDSHPREDLN